MPFFPEEIASKTFSTGSAEGYDPIEVAAFLSELAREYRRALESEVAGESPQDAVSKEVTEIMRSAGEWAERHVLAAKEEARRIEERAVSDLNESLHASEVEEERAYEAARKRARAVVAEARSQSDALLNSTKRRVDELLRQKEKQPARFSTKRQQLLDEINTVEKISLRLRTDLVQSKNIAADRDETVRLLVVSSDDRTLAPMAAALLKRALAERRCTWAEVSSAGLSGHAGEPPDERIRSFLGARSIDISPYRSRIVDAGDVLQADLVLAMTQSERRQILQRVPEANVVLVKELQNVSVNGSRNAEPRERIRALVAQAVRDGDGYDLDAVGVWPLLYHQCLNEMLPGIDALVSVLVGDSSDLPTDRSIKPAQVAADPTLFDWVRYYGAFIAFFVLVGLAGAGLYIVLAPREYEASTLVVDRGREFSPRQLALVSLATFQSPAVLDPTLSELNMDVSSQEFLNESVDLRPVPDTSALMVIGRSNSLRQAESISEAATASFVSVSDSRTDLTDFVVFGKSQVAPIQRNVARPVAVALGGSVGFWLGIAIAVLHFRVKRPVLGFARALLVSGADRVSIVDGRWSWLGMLRPRRPRSSPESERPRPRDDQPSSRAEPISWFGEGNGTKVIVAHPGTQERELGLAHLTTAGIGSADPPTRVKLVWLR